MKSNRFFSTWPTSIPTVPYDPSELERFVDSGHALRRSRFYGICAAISVAALIALAVHPIVQELRSTFPFAFEGFEHSSVFAFLGDAPVLLSATSTTLCLWRWAHHRAVHASAQRAVAAAYQVRLIISDEIEAARDAPSFPNGRFVDEPSVAVASLPNDREEEQHPRQREGA